MGVRGPTRSVRAGAELANYTFQRPATWDLFDLGEEIASARLERNALALSVGPELGYLTAGNNVTHSDLLINATVRQTEGLLGNGFGLLCRADKAGNGYWFLLSSRGEFSIQLASAPRAKSSSSWCPGATTASSVRACMPTNCASCARRIIWPSSSTTCSWPRPLTTSLAVAKLAVALGATESRASVSFDDIRLRAATVTGSR